MPDEQCQRTGWSRLPSLNRGPSDRADLAVMADLQRCVVQFIHPGGEHGPERAGGKRWNRGLHKRKFLRVPGEYLTARDGWAQADDLLFWGEWEPESDVSPIAAPVAAGPKFLHQPYYVRPRAYPGDLQNTDPFVFGDHFLYTLCRQTKPIGGRARPTFLRDLAAGSLILFGSFKGGGFVLDTAFVVADGILHDAESWPSSLCGLISDTYADVTMRPTYQTAWPHQLRLYCGATPATRLEGMFSFAPCLPVGVGSSGFARPTVALKDIITPGLMMGVKATRGVSLDALVALWNSVVKQVLDQELALGTRFDTPERRDS